MYTASPTAASATTTAAASRRKRASRTGPMEAEGRARRAEAKGKWRRSPGTDWDCDTGLQPGGSGAAKKKSGWGPPGGGGRRAASSCALAGPRQRLRGWFLQMYFFSVCCGGVVSVWHFGPPFYTSKYPVAILIINTSRTGEKIKQFRQQN
jgi:hypothetical protein